MIVPSIDLMGGKAVQLRQGRDKVLERDDVHALAERFARVGEIAVIDLDAALGQGDNRELVKGLCRRFPCRVGGGIRTADRGREMLRAGAEKLIIGTAATPEFLASFKPEQVIVAVDEKAGEVVDQGWRRGTGESAVARVRALEDRCSGFLYTVVDREGLLQGTALDRIRAVREATARRVTAAGGISSVEEVKALAAMGVESQLGMAIYTGVLEPEALLVSLVDFDKGGGLAPTVVEDEEGRLLMVAFSSPGSLERALSEGRGVYFSRSRNEVWVKGETSGHRQTLVRARLDCDRDALRFTVRQEGPACHSGEDTCFGRLPFSLPGLERVLRDRLASPRPGSYSSELLKDERAICRKLNEEAYESIDARGPDETTWEVADLVYMATALLVTRGLSWRDVLRELRGRER